VHFRHGICLQTLGPQHGAKRVGSLDYDLSLLRRASIEMM
jgi:hypothetical protein